MNKLLFVIGCFAAALMGVAYAGENVSILSGSLGYRLSVLEKQSGGRLGVAAIDFNSNQRIAHRADERFPMGCTSKVIGVAALLKNSMQDVSLLQKRITYTKMDLTNWNPVTEKHLKMGMTLAELSAAAIRYSDNAAMNLLLPIIGGPKGMTQFARSLGDLDFRQDHNWPDEAKSGGKDNVYDSTTPKAMVDTLTKLAFGNVLAKHQRELLLQWLKTNTTGDARIRAGVPKDWVVGDKTGTGYDYGTTNDIAIIWPPHCKPIVIAVYYTSDTRQAPKRNDLIAVSTRQVLGAFAQNDDCLAKQLR